MYDHYKWKAHQAVSSYPPWVGHLGWQGVKAEHFWMTGPRLILPHYTFSHASSAARCQQAAISDECKNAHIKPVELHAACPQCGWLYITQCAMHCLRPGRPQNLPRRHEQCLAMLLTCPAPNSPCLISMQDCMLMLPHTSQLCILRCVGFVNAA